MPSRRTLLASIGAGVPLAFAGCLLDDGRVEAYVQFKSIGGVTESDGRRENVDILSVDASYEPNVAPPDVHLHDAWADRFPEPRMPVVSDDLHTDLTDQFDSVRYVVGTTSPEWGDDEPVGSFNVATTRENFNRVQVHTAITASSDGTYLTIHSVDGLWEFGSTEAPTPD
ncbi:conserved hypothetical protein [Halorhabdus utahensis DSM 12940]|uniref:Lipoprotein n=1 Tax=Halorhabdus utahensis (strain DSM 12940 / JCM 11049 / AX-2) TaxID=519442 RepID=C7NTI2_HALUD|nr:hypothetical protein [Halorhabdus utahensis]ACV12172.1 conserved hypothetical protein [Halorhabdus utahensis DSM 12940]